MRLRCKVFTAVCNLPIAWKNISDTGNPITTLSGSCLASGMPAAPSLIANDCRVAYSICPVWTVGGAVFVITRTWVVPSWCLAKFLSREGRLRGQQDLSSTQHHLHPAPTTIRITMTRSEVKRGAGCLVTLCCSERSQDYRGPISRPKQRQARRTVVCTLVWPDTVQPGPSLVPIAT